MLAQDFELIDRNAKLGEDDLIVVNTAVAGDVS